MHWYWETVTERVGLNHLWWRHAPRMVEGADPGRIPHHLEGTARAKLRRYSTVARMVAGVPGPAPNQTHSEGDGGAVCR